jgi:hypothetical protein
MVHFRLSDRDGMVKQPVEHTAIQRGTPSALGVPLKISAPPLGCILSVRLRAIRNLVG